MSQRVRVIIEPDDDNGPDQSDLQTFGHTYDLDENDTRGAAIIDLLEKSTNTGVGTEILLLAGLPEIEYERVRKKKAKELGIRPAALDGEVKKQRTNLNGQTSGQGQAVEFEDCEPWPVSVNGAEILEEASTTFQRYLLVDQTQADALALWAAHAHIFDAFVHTPRLVVKSAEKGCGKTLLLDVLATMTPRPIRTENVTTAVLFRVIEKYTPTLLIDECDSFLNDNEELRGALNAGHKRGGTHLRCEGDKNDLRAFKTFAPSALAGIRTMPDTLESRSIIIRMVRAKHGEIRARFDSRHIENETVINRKFARWAIDKRKHLEVSEPDLPQEAFNRVADVWRPLFAIAEASGGDWPFRARRAFKALQSVADDESIRAQLLTDIRELFETQQTDRLLSSEICEDLAKREDRPWPEFGRTGKPITPRQLARLLQPFGVVPRTMRTETERAKGYLLESFEETFLRYLPPSDPCQRDNTEKTSTKRDFRSVTHLGLVTDEKTQKQHEISTCHGVTDVNPLKGQINKIPSEIDLIPDEPDPEIIEADLLAESKKKINGDRVWLYRKRDNPVQGEWSVWKLSSDLDEDEAANELERRLGYPVQVQVSRP